MRKLLARLLSDRALRQRAAAHASVGINGAYALFQLCLGLYHRHAWFFSLAVYYFGLTLLRFGIQQREGRTVREEAERLRCRLSGILLLIMNTALGAMVFYMVYRDRTFHHHEITAIAMAAYTFTAFTLALTDLIRSRREMSLLPLRRGVVNLTAASVSVLTLTSTLITAFGEGADDFARLMTGLVGGFVLLFALLSAIYLILLSKRERKTENNREKENCHE